MSGISGKALKTNYAENKYKYNGIEFENDFDLNTYDAQLRELDPQIGLWWELDPKIDNMEMWSPYSSNYDNPIRYSDQLGDEGQECCKEVWDAIVQTTKDVLTFTASAANAFVTNQVGGVGRGDPNSFSNSHDAAVAQAGATTGDVLTIIGSGISTIGSAVVEVASFGSASGIAIPLAIHQVTVAAPTAMRNLSKDLSKDRVNSSSNSSSSEPPSNRGAKKQNQTSTGSESPKKGSRATRSTNANEQVEGISIKQEKAKRSRPSIIEGSGEWEGASRRPKQNKISSIEKSKQNQRTQNRENN